jgi:hypothetical protein
MMDLISRKAAKKGAKEFKNLCAFFFRNATVCRQLVCGK